jgi:hypothetical protein
MATTMSLTTTYAGKYAGEYIRAAFLANESLQYLTVKENIDYKQVVKKLVDDISFEEPTCDFTPLGTVTITERVLTLSKFQVQRNICKNDFLNDWAAGDFQRGEIEPALADALIANMLEGMAAKNEELIWTGDATTNPGIEYDGLLTQFNTGGSGVLFVPTPVAINTTNVISRIAAVVALLPTAVKRATEKPTIYISQNVWEAFMIVSAAAGNGWYTYGGPEMPKSYLGYQLAVCGGMPDDTIIMGQKTNLWFGTNVLADWNNIQLVDMGQFAEDNVRFSAKFFAGAQFGFGNEIAAYGTWF